MDLFKRTEALREKTAENIRKNLQMKYALIKIWQKAAEPTREIKLQTSEHVKKYKYQMMNEFKKFYMKNK